MTKLINMNIDEKYLNKCIQFFYVWASKSSTTVFYKNPPSYDSFLENLESKDEDEQLKYILKILQDFQTESTNKNPLDLLFSQITNWNINFHLVIKDFIPYVIRVAPHVKFKRVGCFLQTNNHWYLFSEVFKDIILQMNWNNNSSNHPALEDLLVVFLGIRYRQIHGEKDFTHFEDKFFNAYNKAMEQTEVKLFETPKEAFADFRQKLLQIKITNEHLYNSLKSFQNLLGKNSLSSTKKETFFWQMYADLHCVDKHNYNTPFQENFFLQIKYSEKNLVNIVFNKEYFKAMKQLGFVERIGTHRVVYIYLLYNLHKKVKEQYYQTNTEKSKAASFVDALRSSEPIFSNFEPFIPEMKEYFKGHKSEIANTYSQLIDTLNDKFFLDSIATIKNYTDFLFKEELGILDYIDRKKLYKPYL